MGRPPPPPEHIQRAIDEHRQRIRQIDGAKQVKLTIAKVLKAYVKKCRAMEWHASADRLKELLVKYRTRVITSSEATLELYKMVGGKKRVRRFGQALNAPADAGSTEETAAKPTYDYGMHGDAEDEDENEGTRLLDSLPERDDSVWFPWDTG